MSASRTPRPLDAVGVAGMILCCALWGANSVAVKYANGVGGLPPIGCAALRFLISLPFVIVGCRLGNGAGRLAVPRKYWGLLLLHGTLSAVQIATYNWGTSHSEAGRSSVFINVHPLITVVLAWLLLGEHLGTKGWLGLACAVSGVGVILYRQLSLGGGLEGDLVVLFSGVIFAVQTIAQKLTFPLIPPRTLLPLQTAIALPIAGLMGAGIEGFHEYHFTLVTTLGLVYQAVLVSGLCFILWFILLDRYEVGRLATIAFMTPVFGLTAANLFRGDPLTPPILFGGCLVGAGIYLVSIRRPPAAGVPESSCP